MKYWLWAIVAYTVAFCLSGGALWIRLRGTVIKSHGIAIWKQWR